MGAEKYTPERRAGFDAPSPPLTEEEVAAVAHAEIDARRAWSDWQGDR